MKNLYAPWHTGDYDPRVVFDARGTEVVTVHGHYDDTVHKAQLIAAAPLMYDALRAMATDYDMAFLSDPEEFIKRHMPQVTAALESAGGK